MQAVAECGTVLYMPTHLPEAALREAELAVAHAQDVRVSHRRRSAKTDRQRQHDLTLAFERVKEAMLPLRSEIGKFPYGPQTDQAEENRETIRQASAALQRERRKLWKMLQEPKKPRRKKSK